jgi:hypothetical protein
MDLLHWSVLELKKKTHWKLPLASYDFHFTLYICLFVREKSNGRKSREMPLFLAYVLCCHSRTCWDLFWWKERKIKERRLSQFPIVWQFQTSWRVFCWYCNSHCFNNNRTSSSMQLERIAAGRRGGRPEGDETNLDRGCLDRLLRRMRAASWQRLFLP